MITAAMTCRDAYNMSVAKGGFVYKYCGEYFWVPASAIEKAEECGMTLFVC